MYYNDIINLLLYHIYIIEYFTKICSPVSLIFSFIF